MPIFDERQRDAIKRQMAREYQAKMAQQRAAGVVAEPDPTAALLKRNADALIARNAGALSKDRGQSLPPDLAGTIVSKRNAYANQQRNMLNRVKLHSYYPDEVPANMEQSMARAEAEIPKAGGNFGIKRPAALASMSDQSPEARLAAKVLGGDPPPERRGRDGRLIGTPAKETIIATRGGKVVPVSTDPATSLATPEKTYGQGFNGQPWGGDAGKYMGESFRSLDKALVKGPDLPVIGNSFGSLYRVLTGRARPTGARQAAPEEDAAMAPEVPAVEQKSLVGARLRAAARAAEGRKRVQEGVAARRVRMLANSPDGQQAAREAFALKLAQMQHPPRQEDETDKETAKFMRDNADLIKEMMKQKYGIQTPATK